jgi:hypothetical protein
MNKNLNYDKLEKYPLSDSDLKDILGDNIKIIIYPNLNDVYDIEEIFDDMGRCMVLFLTEDQYTGHWLCLHKEGDDIYYFDPYGEKIDADRKWLGKSKLQELHEEKPLLKDLLLRSGKKIYYNSYPFQEDREDINTCGRHCSTRLLYKHLDLDDYYDMIRKSNLNPDQFVSNITYKILNK